MMTRISAYPALEIFILFAMLAGISSTPITNSTTQFQLQKAENENSSYVHPLNVPTNESVSGSKDNLLNSHSVSNVTNELLQEEENEGRAQTPGKLESESFQETPLTMASEVGDLLKRTSANDTSSQKEDENDEDDSDEVNDTVLVNNPNVKDEGKTHDEDSKVDGTANVIDTTTVSNDAVIPQYLQDNTTTINDNAQMDTNVNHTMHYVETNTTIIIGTTNENFTVSTESVNTMIKIHNNSYDNDEMKDESQITGCENNNNNKEVHTSVPVCKSTIARKHINSTTGSGQQNNSANNVAVVTKVKEVDVGSTKEKEENSPSYVKSDVNPTNADHAAIDVFPTENILDTGDNNSRNLQPTEKKKADENHNSDIKTDRSPGTLDTAGNVIKAPPSPQSFASLQHAENTPRGTGKSAAFLQPTESAAILAGVFVSIALFGYVGLLVWRRILEKRYGNREMLVNEDDFYDTSDLRHFEL